MNPRRALVVAQRELETLARTRTVLLLGTGYVVVVLALFLGSGTGGYIPAVLDLLTPMEVLVPALAFAFGYRAVLADATRGELETLRTYPLDRTTFVVGVFVGRLAGFLPVVLVPLLAAGGLVAVGGPEQVSVLAGHGTVDTPVLYLRFVTLTVAFATVSLAAAVAVSAAARSTREALALAVALVLALVVGFDATIVAALAGGLVGPDSLSTLAGLSPNSAYRGLVFGLAVGETYVQAAPLANPLTSALGLLGWFVGSLTVAVRAVW